MNKIQDNTFYSLKELVVMQVFGWLTHTGDISNDSRAYRREIERDKENKNMLRPIIRGEGRNKRYSFKGIHIKCFVRDVESGKYQL